MMLSPVSRPKSFKSKKRPGVGEAWCLPPPAGTTKPLAAVISISSVLELSTNYKASPDHETELLSPSQSCTKQPAWDCGVADFEYAGALPQWTLIRTCNSRISENGYVF